MHPNMKVQSTPKSTIWHFWSADRHFKSAKWYSWVLTALLYLGVF